VNQLRPDARHRALRRAFAYGCSAAYAAVLAACTPGLDDEAYGPPVAPPPRPDTLPAAYASVAAFCASPEDPPGEPLQAADTAGTPPLREDRRVPGMKDMWFNAAMRCIVREQAQLEQLWTFARDPAAAPEVDFGEHVLILATAGQMGSGGYALGITAVWQRGDTAFVAVGEHRPGHGCMGDAEVVTPADAVRIPRVSTVRFHETIVSGERCL
jgi:hypothetical protein